MMRITPYGTAKEIAPGIVRVTFGKGRRVAPQNIRARVALAGYYDTLSKDLTEPTIVAQGRAGEWATWEARKKWPPTNAKD